MILLYNPNKIIVEVRIRDNLIHKAKKLLSGLSDPERHMNMKNWALIKDPLVLPDGKTLSNKAAGVIATFFCWGKEEELIKTCEEIRTALIDIGIERIRIDITIGKEV